MFPGSWILIVLFAAAAQTGRNAAQRSLTSQVGTWGATLVRFLFGLPLATAILLLLYLVPAVTPALPPFSVTYLGWIALGAIFQIAATAALLLAMESRNFAVAVTLSKTEVLQVMLFSTILLAEWPTALDIVAIILATTGLILLSMPSSTHRMQWQAWAGKPGLYGLLCGFCFAVATVAFRGGALALGDTHPLYSGAWGVFIAQSIQSVVLGGWLAWREPEGLRPILRTWRVSMIAGSLGALASLAWFTAYALQSVAHVRTVGMVEVLFSYVISRRLFHEHIRPQEKWGMALMMVGLICICLNL